MRVVISTYITVKQTSLTVVQWSFSIRKVYERINALTDEGYLDIVSILVSKQVLVSRTVLRNQASGGPFLREDILRKPGCIPVSGDGLATVRVSKAKYLLQNVGMC